MKKTVLSLSVLFSFTLLACSPKEGVSTFNQKTDFENVLDMYKLGKGVAEAIIQNDVDVTKVAIDTLDKESGILVVNDSENSVKLFSFNEKNDLVEYVKFYNANEGLSDDELEELKKKSFGYMFVYEYDADGKKKNRTVVGLENKDTLATLNYKYDNKGRLVEEEIGKYTLNELYLADGVFALQYKYDDEGRLAELLGKDRDGKLVRHETYTYDKEGRKSSMKILLGAKLNGDECKYIYDEKNNVVAIENYYGGKLELKNVYKYDNRGSVIEEDYEVLTDEGKLELVSECIEGYTKTISTIKYYDEVK